MSGLETRVSLSLEDGALVMRMPAFERNMREMVHDVIAGQAGVGVDEWLRNNLTPADRLALLELLDPPIQDVAREAARLKAESLPADMSDQTFTKAMEDWSGTLAKEDRSEPTGGPGDRLFWIVANGVRDFTKDCHPDLETKYKAGHEHLHEQAKAKFWSDCCGLVSFWVERSLDDLWEDYLKRHGREE